MSRHAGLRNGLKNGLDGKRGNPVEKTQSILKLNNVEFKGERIHRKTAMEISKMGIIQVIEGRKVFEHLTVEENLKVGAHLRNIGSTKDGLEMVYHYFPRLRQKRNEVAGYVSGGEQQMTVMGRALMAQPKLMLLAEPSMV